MFDGRYIRVRFIDLIHFFVIRNYGGADSVLNEGNVESAIYSPKASFGGQDLYDTKSKKCYKLFRALVSNHGYQDYYTCLALNRVE